jgi:hypothetical protein
LGRLRRAQCGVACCDYSLFDACEHGKCARQRTNHISEAAKAATVNSDPAEHRADQRGAR